MQTAMTGDHDRDLKARLAELEATVRGLTQELVSAEERIRQLEAGRDDAADEPATRASGEAGEAGSEATPAEATDGTDQDLDDIIVA